MAEKFYCSHAEHKQKKSEEGIWLRREKKEEKHDNNLSICLMSLEACGSGRFSLGSWFFEIFYNYRNTSLIGITQKILVCNFIVFYWLLYIQPLYTPAYLSRVQPTTIQNNLNTNTLQYFNDSIKLLVAELFFQMHFYVSL